MQLTPEDIDVLRNLFREELKSILRADTYSNTPAPLGSFMARRAQALERHEMKRSKKIGTTK